MPKLTLENEKLNLYYEVFGPTLSEPDVKTMVFIHGGPGIVDGRLYYDFWSQFASENLRVVFFEQRGSGRSDDPESPETLNISQHAKDVHAFCEALHIEKPIIAGVSQGGYVALSYAAQFPHDLCGLVITNTEAKRDTEARCKAYKTNAVTYFGASAEAGEKAAAAIKELDTHWSTTLSVEPIFPFFTKNTEAFVGEYHPVTCERYMKNEWGSFDLRPDLSKIICPVLYLAGRYDCVHPLSSALETMELLPHAEFHILEAAAPVYADKKEESLALVTDFVKKIACEPTCSAKMR